MIKKMSRWGALLSVVVVVFLLPRWDISLGWPWLGVLTCGTTFLFGSLARRLLPAP